MTSCRNFATLALRGLSFKAGTHQADGRPLANVRPTASDGRASLFGVFHSSALVGLTSAAVCPIQHVKSASGRFYNNMSA